MGLIVVEDMLVLSGEEVAQDVGQGGYSLRLGSGVALGGEKKVVLESKLLVKGVEDVEFVESVDG